MIVSGARTGLAVKFRTCTMISAGDGRSAWRRTSKPTMARLVFAAVDFDETQMRRRLGVVFRAGEGAVADHHHSIRTAAFEKGVGEIDRLFDSPGRVGGVQVARQLAQAALDRR